MIYLIGGAPRTGKSLLAQKIVATHPMSSLSCDFLYDLTQVKNINNFAEADLITKGTLFYPTLQELLINVSRRSENCVIDGEVILPQFIPELATKYNIKSCFIGLPVTNLDTILTHGGYFNWPKWKLENGLATEINDLAEQTINKSLIIKTEAQKYNLPYFDLTENYNLGIKLAIKSLLS